MWLAAYLFYNGNWEDFLKKAVNPFVNSIIEKKWADQYFFIRYWENGPHIRLRFKGKQEILINKVKPELDQYFTSYFKKNLSEREDPEWVKHLAEKDKWFPDNTIQYIKYEPEIDRYGGPIAIEIAEKQFQASSNAVFDIISQTNNWSYERALGAAIQLHLGFSYAMGMTLDEMKHFYTFIFSAWLPRAYNYNVNNNLEQNQAQQKIVLEAFEKTFIKQQEMLVPYHQTVWEAFHDNIEFEDEWLNTWLTEIKKIKQELKNVVENKQIKFQSYFTPNPVISVDINQQKFWSIYESYVHMTNNRLGVLNQDEAYLGFLINRSLGFL